MAQTTAHAPRSVISANVKLALLCRSMFSENTRVLRARRGSPEKKSVSPRCAKKKKSQLQVAEWRQLRCTYVFEILEEVGNRLPFAVGEDIFVQAIAGFA